MDLMIELDGAGVFLIRLRCREFGMPVSEAIDIRRYSQCTALRFQIAVALRTHKKR